MSKVSSAFILDLKGPGTKVSPPSSSFPFREVLLTGKFQPLFPSAVTACPWVGRPDEQLQAHGWVCRGPGHPGVGETSTRGYKTMSFDSARRCGNSESARGRGRGADPAGLCAVMRGGGLSEDIGDGR